MYSLIIYFNYLLIIHHTSTVLYDHTNDPPSTALHPPLNFCLFLFYILLTITFPHNIHSISTTLHYNKLNTSFFGTFYATNCNFYIQHLHLSPLTTYKRCYPRLSYSSLSPADFHYTIINIHILHISIINISSSNTQTLFEN